MSQTLTKHTSSTIELEILQHPAWLGYVPGLMAEKLLRGKKTPYLYVLRGGEYKLHYYATFLHADLTVRHQPFVITLSPEGWYYENYGGGGPYQDHISIEDVLYSIMHCEKGQNMPLINSKRICR
jgi:hypothetical protein